MGIPNVQYQRFSWTRSFRNWVDVWMLTQCLQLVTQQIRRMVISRDWNPSISRKKMTAFLYEGLVKTHWAWSTWGRTRQPKPSPHQKLLQHQPRPIFLDHRLGSYSKSPLLTTGVRVLQKCVGKISVCTDVILWASFLWGSWLTWMMFQGAWA